MNTIIIKLLLILFIILSNNIYADKKSNNEKITLQLQWKHQFQFAGYYIAKEKGFYNKAGFDVQIKEYDFNIDVIKEVLDKKATYATGRSSLVINKSQGDKIVLLAAIFQSSPDILLALKESNIKAFKDFKNKRIMITGDAKNDLIYSSMLFSQKISPNKDMFIQKHSFNLEDLVNKKTDLMASYISNEPFRLKEEYNLESVIFDPKDYGFDFYADILFTHEDEIKNNPNKVKSFKDATLEGWSYAFNNIEETVNIILNKYNSQKKSKKALIYEANELKKLAYYNTNKLGKLDINKIERIYDSYKLMGMAQKKFNFKDFIFNGMEHKIMLSDLEKKYLKEKKDIKMCIDPDWMPFEKFDKKGNYVGLSSDYFNFFKNQLEIDIKVIKTDTWTQSLEYFKNKKCDILSLVMPTDSRKKYMNFTRQYLEMPLVLATKLNVTFIDNFQILKNKKIGIVKDYAYVEIIKLKYPNIKVIEVKNTKEGLRKVENEELFGFLGSIADVSYITQKYFIGQLKIAGKVEEKLQLSIGTKKDEPLLRSIFDKLIISIPQTLKDDILNKHITIKYENRVDYTLLWKTILIFLLVISIILYWIYTVKKAKKELEIIMHKLEFTKDQLKNKNKELKYLAATDSLTKLNNRLKIDKVLRKEFLRDKRFKHTFGIIILDIDDFKKINDTYGHQAGDKVLVEFANILTTNIRHIDTVGRWGGEEFLVICPETDLEGTVKVATLLKNIIANNVFPEVNHVTASFGVSSFTDEASINNLISKADKALYKAKENGKNRVEEY